MGSRFRPYLALAAMLAIQAKSSLATSAVETARAHEPAVQTAVALDTSQGAPASPLPIAGALAMADSAVQIQLGSAEPGQREASLFGGASLLGVQVVVDVAPQQ